MYAAPQALPAQQPSPGDSATADTVAADTVAAGTVAAAADTAAADTVAAAADSAAADTLARVRGEIEVARERLQDVRHTLESFPAAEKLRYSPRGAVLRAFALPGWGQFYTGHRFRGLLYGGAEVGFATLGFLKQRQVLDLFDVRSEGRLAFIAAEQAAHPDSLFSPADTLQLFDRFGSTAEGSALQASIDAKQKRREDYFTYAIFSVLFGAIDAFVSAHLQMADAPQLDVSPASDGWRLDLRVPLGSGAPTRPADGSR